jgi:hypothetical protein
MSTIRSIWLGLLALFAAVTVARCGARDRRAGGALPGRPGRLMIHRCDLAGTIMKSKNLLTAVLIGALLAIALPGALAPARAQGVESPLTRSIRIATKEVTDPDVAVSSDGEWLVFTALGHLVQLPAAGGATKQLTSGPFYDSAPAISPDGTRVAFISDRKVSSQGNVFVLDIASGQIRQVTDEFWVDRPVWSPDGKSLAFLSYQRIGPVGNYWFVGPNLLKSQFAGSGSRTARWRR